MENSWVLGKLWQSEATKILEASPDIERVKKTSYFISVKFKNTGITEHWALREESYDKKKLRVIPFSTEDPIKLNKKSQIHCQFETNPYYKNDYEILRKHFIITKESLRNTSFINKRITIHNLTKHLHDEACYKLEYTGNILYEDLEKLKDDYKNQRHQSSLIRFIIYNTKSEKAKRILYHFTPISQTTVPSLKSMTKIYTVIDKLSKTNRDITKEAIIDKLNPIHMVSPNYYRSIFNQWYLVAGKRIIDFYCTSGSKSLAIMMDGGKYYHTKNNYNNGLNNIANFFKFTPPSIYNNTVLDLAIISRDRPLNRDIAELRIKKYNNTAKKLMLMINKNDLIYFKEKHKPTRILRIASEVGKTAFEDNYLLIIDQK